MAPADWNYVKKHTLWEYEILIEKIQAVLDYPFVREHYALGFSDAADYARKLLPAAGWKDPRSADSLACQLESLGDGGLSGIEQLVARIGTRADCESFILESSQSFAELIDILTYIFRWALPFPTPLRELLDHADPVQHDAFTALKTLKLRTNLDLLEIARSRSGREQLSEASRIPYALLHALVHRCDIARLPWVRGKTVMIVCAAGYDTLAKIAAADLDEMEACLDALARKQGKTWEDYKSVIVIRWLVGGAGVLPQVAEDEYMHVDIRQDEADAWAGFSSSESSI